MLRRLPPFAVLCGCLAVAGPAAAHSNGDAFAVGAVVGAVVGGAIVAGSAPYPYYAPPPPAYYYPPPPPVYYEPVPVYRPIVVVPAPRYYGPRYYAPRRYGPAYYGPPGHYRRW